MPVTIRKVKGGYQVRTPNGIYAKKAMLKKAKSQERLLNAIDHNKDWYRKQYQKRKKKNA